MRFLVLFILSFAAAAQTRNDYTNRVMLGSLDVSGGTYSRPMVVVGSDPSGACPTANAMVLVSVNGKVFACVAGTWTQISGSGGGGSSAFSDITTGVNAGATMTLGTGSALTFSGSGTVNANRYNGNAVIADGDVAATIARDSEVAAGYQPLDTDLTAIAGISPARGAIVRRGASAWEGLALGASTRVLKSDGTDAVWGQVALTELTMVLTGTRCIESSADGLSLVAAAAPCGSGGGGLSNAYSTMTDGTVTAAAVSADVFKFRSASNLISTAVQSNDATHGDNLLLTVNQGNFTLSSIGGAVTDAQVPDTITLTNLTQVGTRNYSDLQNVPTTIVLESDIGTGLAVTTGTVNFDPTELTNLTWSAGGSASIIWTFDVIGTDHTMTAGNGLVNFSGTIQQGGTAVVIQSRAVNTSAPLGGGGALSGDLTLTCATCATSANNLSFFASTTSAQLATLLSDETGTAGGFLRATTSATVGQVLRIETGPLIAFGAVDLADTDAITGLLPDANIAATIARDSEVAAAYQPLDSDLTALAGASATGFWDRTGAGTGAPRTFTATSPVAITNGGGGGNPAVSLAGLTTLGTANFIVGANAGATAWEYKQLVQGSNITITHGVGTVTLSATGGGAAGAVSNTFATSATTVTVTDNLNTLAKVAQCFIGTAPDYQPFDYNTVQYNLNSTVIGFSAASGAGHCTVSSGGAAAGGGAPTDATYITQTASGGLSAEQALSALATGILKVTTTSGVLSTAVAGDFPTLNQSTTGNAATATALAANGGNCTGNNFALGVDASGVAECAQPAFSNLSGSATDAQVPDTITASNYLLLAGGTLTGQLVTDNLGIEFDESDTNPTCAAGNYTIFADLSELKLKKCVNGTATDLDTGGSGTELTAAATSGADNTVLRSVGNSRAMEGTGVTINDSNEVVAVGFRTPSGAVAGLIELTQGTACTPSANSACYYAPASITTAYGVVSPSAIGATGVVKVSVSGAVATLSHAAIVDADVPDTITASNYQPLDAALTAIAAGSDFVQFTGPATSTKVFTLPNAAATILTSNAAVTVGQGGTGLTTGTSGGIPYFSSTSAITSSAALNANAVVIGGGAGATPATISASTTTTHALMATAGAPAFRALVDGDIPDTITVSNYLLLAGGTLTGQLVASNLGIEFAESDTNPTCAAGNYAVYADLSEGRFKKCSNGAVTDLDTTGAGFGETSLSTLNTNQTLWDSASASRTLTFGLSGATDPVLTIGDALINISAGLLQVGGDEVITQTASTFLAFGSNPADASRIRFSNTEGLAWEAATPGTDLTLVVNASDRLSYSGVIEATRFRTSGAATGVYTTLEGTSPGAGAAAGEHNLYVDSADSLLKSHENGGAVVVYARTADNLSVFASTTSSQLASVLSDENGSSGGFVRNTGATVSTMIINSSFATSLTITTDIRANAAGSPTLGTNALPFGSAYIGAAATNNIQLTGTATTAKVATFPDVTGTVAVAATSTTTTQALFATATAGAPAFRAIVAGDLPSSSTTASGVVELAIDTEVTTGTDATRAVTPDALAGSTIFGTRTVEVEIFAPGTAATTGDGKAYFRIPASLNGMNLISVKANVYTAGTTGTVSIGLDRCAAAATGNICSGTVSNVFTTNYTIDSAENSTSTAAAAGVIDTANDDVATDQLYRINIDSIHTTASQGLLIELTFQLP